MTDSTVSPDVEALVREHLPLVGHVARGLATRLPSHVCRDDLISAGMAGLTEAALGFDASLAVPFGRYAQMRIRGAMLDELRSADWVTRGVRSRDREYQAAGDRLTQTLGRTPNSAELATELGIDLAVLEARRAETSRRTLSLDSLEAAIGESIADPAPDPGQQLVASERLTYLRAAVAALPARLRTVVTGLFFEERPLAELAEELEVSESRISQLKAEGLALLHDAMSATHGDAAEAGPRIPAQATAARKREAYYADVVAGAARAGVGSQAATNRDKARRAAADATRSEQREPLRPNASRPI